MFKLSMGLPADYECGYCCDPIGTMKDPRELPCGHVFCFQCIKNDVRKGVAIVCLSCSKSHNDISLDALSEYNHWEKEEEKGQSAELEGVDEKELAWDPLPCSKPQCSENTVCYCGTCKSELCEKHKHAHDEWYDSHRYIPYDEYRNNPEKYKDPKCPAHAFKLILACEKCDKIYCRECDLTPRCNQGGQCVPKSLSKIEQKIKKEYQGSIQKISRMHTEFSARSKEVWYKFDDLVVTYDEEAKIQMVDQIAAQQIAEITRRAGAKKALIRDFPKLMDDQVTTYVDELQQKESQLNDLQNELGMLIREKHITEVIRDNKVYKKKIEQALKLVMGECDILRKMAAAPTGFIHDIEIDLRPSTPKGLIKLNVGSITPTHLSITDRGGLLFYDSANGQVKITGIHHKHIKFAVSVQQVVSVAQFCDKVFVAKFSGGITRCNVFSYNLSHAKEVCRFRSEAPSRNLPQMAIVKDYLVIIERTSYTQGLLMVALDGEKPQRTVALPNQPFGIWAQPGSAVIIQEQNYMAKYDLSSGQAIKRWRVKRGSYPTATDPTGMIYQSRGIGFKANLVMIDPQTGVELGERVETEESSIGQLAIKCDMVACTDSRSKLQLYQIVY